MNTVPFIGAAFVMLAVSVFIYFNYPKRIREKRWLRILLIAFHSLGVMSLFGIFVVYRHLKPEWLKFAVSRYGTIYYEMSVLMAIFFGVRLVLKWGYIGIMKLMKKEIPQRRKKWITDKTVHSFLFLGIAHTIAVIGFININFLHTANYEIYIDKPSALEELNITMIADTHCGAGTWYFTYDKLEKMILDTNPDVLLIAGDAFDETTSEKDVEYLRGVIEDIHPKYGIYYVYGNHDEYTDDWAANKMREMGVTVLKDEKAFLEDVQLVGRLDYKESPLPLEELNRSLNVDFSKPAIVLQHRPREFKKLSSAGYDLVMTGHTHGFNIPQGLTLYFLYDMLHGHREYGNMDAVVTSGVSAWGFHYKFPSRSEIVKMHITFAK